MQAGAAKFAPLRFSTRKIPERERIASWREEFGRRLLRVDIEPASDLPFHAEAALRALPGLRTISFTGSATRYDRDRALARGGDGAISLIVNADAMCAASQRGREATLGPGDAVAVLHEEPATVSFGAGSYFALFVPRDALTPLAANVDDATLRAIPRDRTALRLLVNYVKLVKDERVLSAPRLCREVVSHIHGLLALTLNPDRPLDEDGLSAIAAGRLRAAIDQIAACFQEPELSVAEIARSLGISPRYLQRLLETTGTSFTERVTELRLQKALELLSDAGDPNRRVTDIALESGFSDISHFNRLFRYRFGDTPSGVRTQARKTQ
jgi:AraC-like DNA-binding protein